MICTVGLGNNRGDSSLVRTHTPAAVGSLYRLPPALRATVRKCACAAGKLLLFIIHCRVGNCTAELPNWTAGRKAEALLSESSSWTELDNTLLSFAHVSEVADTDNTTTMACRSLSLGGLVVAHTPRPGGTLRSCGAPRAAPVIASKTLTRRATSVVPNRLLLQALRLSVGRIVARRPSPSPVPETGQRQFAPSRPPGRHLAEGRHRTTKIVLSSF